MGRSPPRRSREERDDLVRGHEWLVRHLVDKRWRWLRYHGDKDDWVQEASLALVRAAGCWDETKGVQFATYAYRAVVNQLRPKTRARPLSLDRLNDAHGGLFEPSGRDPGTAAEDAEELESALSLLHPKRRRALELTFLGGLRHRDAGREMGVSGERVRQFKEDALRHLRRELGGT